MITPPMNLVHLLFTLLISITTFRLLAHIFLNHNKWFKYILFLPVLIIVFCFVHWRDSRAYVFFFLLTICTAILATSVSGYKFNDVLLQQTLYFGLWPFVLFYKFIF